MFKKLIQKLFGNGDPRRRSVISPIFKERSIWQLTADDVYDAIMMAEGGDTTRLMPLYEQVIIENSHLQTEFTKRKLSVLGDRIAAIPASKDAADQDAAKWVDTAIDDCADWLTAEIALLDSTIYPVSLVDVWYEPGTNGRRYDLRMSRVDPELFDFSRGDFRVFDTVDGHKIGTSHEVESSRYIIHRGHLLTSPDSWGGPLRSLLGWHLLANATPEWWGRFLERLGAPFLVGSVGNDDDAERAKVEQAFSQALRLFGIVVSQGTQIQMLQAQSSQTGEAHQMLHDKACREISKLIIGQTSTADVQSTGSLSNSNTAHLEVKNEFRDWDDRRLCDTLMRQVIVPWMRINGIAGRPPSLAHGTANLGKAKQSVELLKAIPAAGLELTDEAISTLSEDVGYQLQRTAKAPSPAERPAPFSAERGLTLRRPQLLTAAQARLTSATAPRLARHLAAVDIPDEILGTGAEVLLEYLETTTLQGK